MQKTRVESVYQSKEEKDLAEKLQIKVARMICRNSDKGEIKYIMKN